MTEQTYPAARAVAAAVEAHFARHLEEARAQGVQALAPKPGAETIETMIDAAFWASLRREEDHLPTISLVYLPPEEATVGNQLAVSYMEHLHPVTVGSVDATPLLDPANERLR